MPDPKKYLDKDGATYFVGKIKSSQAAQDSIIQQTRDDCDDLMLIAAEHYGLKWEKNNSDPQARCTYLYDCANFTPMQCQSDGTVSLGSWGNAFFVKNNYPAMIKPDGTIDYKLDPTDHAKDLDGNDSHITDHATGNAMAIFDCHIWMKWYEDETYQYVEIANSKLDDDFVDFPYHRADGTIKDKLYYPMFEGSIIGGKLRSLATGAVPQSNITAPEEQSAAQANGANWSIGDWSHHIWMAFLSMLISKSTCPEIALGEGHTTGGSSAASLSKCGELKTAGQFYGKPQAVSVTSPVKLFFSENPYGNRWKRTLGMYNVFGTYYIKSSPPYTVNESYSGYENCGNNPSSSGYIKDLKLTSMGFVPSTVGGSASTYTGAYYYENDAQIDMLVVGGGCSNYALCGFWCLCLNYRPSYRHWSIGASLYLM